MTIWTPDRRLRVFVSSTLGELGEERRVVERAISALRLAPVMFERGARPHPPQDVYRAYLEQSDIFIGLYWQSYGQPAAGSAVSGLEDEFELSAGLPRLLYVKAPAPEREQGLTDLLGRIREEASYKRFGSPRELSRLVRNDLATLLSERFAFSAAPTTLRPAAHTLPQGTTSLVGREQAVDEIAALLTRPDVRLVTLTGPGGIGKTRLAAAVGERLQQEFEAGAAFVSLAEISDPSLAWDAIAHAAGA